MGLLKKIVEHSIPIELLLYISSSMRAKHTSMIKIRIGLKIWKVIIITRNNSHKRTFLSISYAFEIDDHDQNPNRTLMQKVKVTHNSH